MAKHTNDNNLLSLEQKLCSAIWHLSSDLPNNSDDLSKDHRNIIRLMKRGADVNYIDEYGWSPLHLVLKKGYVQLAGLLYYNKSVNVDQVSANAERKTPADIINEKGLLHTAAWDGDNEVIGILITLGADVNYIDEYGWSPLHLALRKENYRLAEGLLQLNAKIDQVSANAEQKTSLDILSQLPKATIEGYAILKYLYNANVEKNLLIKYENGSEAGMDNCIKSGLHEDMVGLLRSLGPKQKFIFINKILMDPIGSHLLASKTVELLEASGEQGDVFITSLFSFSPPVLLPILRNESVKLFSSSSNVVKLAFTTYLFGRLQDTSPEVAASILNYDLIKMLCDDANTDHLSIPNFLHLPEHSLKLIFNEKVLYDLAYNSAMGFSLWKTLCERTGVSTLKLDLQKICLKSLDKLIFLKTSAPLIKSFSEQEVDQLHPVIQSLLSKTYSEIPNEARVDFSKKLVEALNKVIDEKVIAQIIKNAADTEGDIFISSGSILVRQNNTLPELSGTLLGHYFKSNIFVSINNFIIPQILEALVHESTHKLIDKKFDNTLLPYSKDDTSFAKIIESAIANELNKAHKVESAKSWLESMTSSYPPNQFPVEIFPWFIGKMAQAIISKQNTPGISQEFATLIWSYLHTQLFDGAIPGALREICYDSFMPQEVHNLAQDIVTYENACTAALGEGLELFESQN